MNKLNIILKKTLAYRPTFSFITIDLDKIEKAKGRLINSIQTEIYHENKTYKYHPNIVNQFQQYGFEYKEQDNAIELVRQFSNVTVSILFAGVPPVTEVILDKNQEIDDKSDLIKQRIRDKQSESKVIEPLQYSVDFTVLISSDNQETIVYECNSLNQQININYIGFVYDLDHYKKQSKFDKFMRTYPGPPYSTLDERLQSALLDYLQTFGITNSLTTLIEKASLDKEQKSYLHVLKKLQDFLD